ncbi:MAG: hypothetical protein RLZZ40_888 [Actinomycetota bacterium]|jgi:hypothetical protein
MRDALDRGSGTMTNVAIFAALVTVTCGVLAGISVIRNATVALRSAEHAAISVATDLAEGDTAACAQAPDTVVECVTQGQRATVTVVENGVRASASAGPSY